MVGFIDGTEVCLPKDLPTGSLNSAYFVWQKKDACVLGWILASLSERLVSTIYGLKTSEQVHVPAFHISNVNFKCSLKVIKPALRVS